MSKRDQSGILLAKVVYRLSENGVAPERFTGREFFESEPTPEELELLRDLINWLEEEGIVRHHGTRFKNSYNLVLSSAGFRQLETNFRGKLTLGGAISMVAKNEPMTAGLGDFIGGIFGGFTKSVSG